MKLEMRILLVLGAGALVAMAFALGQGELWVAGVLAFNVVLIFYVSSQGKTGAEA